MFTIYKRKKSLSLVLLLLSLRLSESHLTENEERTSEQLVLIDKEGRTQTLEAKSHANKIVTMEAEDLKNILNSEKPLMSNMGSHPENLFSEFKQFLIPFSWSEPQKNDVMKVVANYNKNHFYDQYNQSIRLWVAFPPRNDVNDDIEMVTEVIRKINALYSGTVTTVVLNYGLLQLEHESLQLVNHEIKKVNNALENMKNESLKFALQLNIINCKNRVEFFRNLEFSHLDVLLFSVPTKDVVLKSEKDIPEIMMGQINCFQYLGYERLVTFHSHMSIKINLVEGKYDYNRMFTKSLNRYYAKWRYPIIFWSELDGKRSKNSTKHFESSEMSSEWISWLQRPVQFNKLHLGAVIPVNENKLAPILENFSKITIQINGHSRDARKHLEQIVNKLVSPSASTSANQNRNNDGKNYFHQQRRGQLQITLLVTITKNDLDINKKQVDNAIWAAAYGNKLVTGVVQAIAFDWTSCSIKEVCSGYKNTNLIHSYCTFFNMNVDFQKLYNYTKLALSKEKNLGTILLWDIIDVGIFSKLLYLAGHPECDTVGTKEPPTLNALKYSLTEKDLMRTGAAEMSNVVTAKLSQSTDIYDTLKGTNPYYYVNIVGCNSNYSRTTHLTEFALFYEKLNRWAVRTNVTLHVEAAVENPKECQQMRTTKPGTSCKCGFWVVIDDVFHTEQPEANTINKKALARHLYENMLNSKRKMEEKPTSAVSNEMLLWIFIPTLLLVTLITVVTVVLVMRYRSKYIMTKEEVANFLKGRLKSKSRDESSSAEDQPYNSNKYELSPSSFTIDKSSLVGSGEFGKVYRGSIKRGGTTAESAVKVANTRALGKSHGGRVALMGLLSEIKILSYVGEHDHIVRLLGAFTANLRNGELSVFLEFCELGSLYSYLHSIQPCRSDVESIKDANAIPLFNISNPNETETQRYKLKNGVCDELLIYSTQIASGMAFLASKNVVHADLATRNVLLTREKIARICDFGLSRRMYDYTEYIKQNQAPLPWRWMAPESLRRLIFNEKSDVWAFGITLWEIFTLGDEPYPGLSYDVNFPMMLTRGLRLPLPKYNVKQIYTVMTRCWNNNPVKRPSFDDLIKELSKINGGK